MICRNCSAEIDPQNERCPYCRKDPRKRNRRGATGIVIVIVLLLLIAAAVFIGFNFEKVKKKAAEILPSEIIAVFSPNDDERIDKTTKTTEESTVKKTTEKNTATTKAAEKTSAETTSTTKAAEKNTSVKTTATTERPKSPKAEKIFDLLNAEIKEYSIKTANGATVSKRGLIKADKERLKNTSQADFGKFCLQKVSRSPYSWLTIKFSDSTGIVFTGNCVTSAVYCRLGEDDYIGEVLGTVILSSDGEYVFSKSKSSSAETTKATTVSETSKKDADSKDTTKQDYTVNKNALAEKTSSAKKQTTTKAEETSGKSSSSSVYITDSGKKYHRAGCPSLSKSKHEISLKDAKSEGYTACKRCKP